MNQRQHREFEHRKTLRDNNWEISQRDAVAFNGGSESLEHYLAKAAVAWHLKQQGYRIGSEVSKDGAGEVDLVCYGTEDPPLAIEVEKDMQREVILGKVDRYVSGEPYRDLIPVDVDTLPDVDELREWADEQV